jgi:hypothetical protein
VVFIFRNSLGLEFIKIVISSPKVIFTKLMSVRRTKFLMWKIVRRKTIFVPNPGRVLNKCGY